MIRYIERYGYGSAHNPYDTDYLLVDSDEKGWEYIMRVGACGEINTLHRNESLGKWNVRKKSQVIRSYTRNDYSRGCFEALSISPTIKEYLLVGKEEIMFKYFAFVEECKDYSPFLVMRKSGPYDQQIYTRKDLDNDPELSLEFNDIYYALISRDEGEEYMFIGNNELADMPNHKDRLFTHKRLTMKVLKKYGIDKLDKMTLATAVLKRHPVAMWLRPLLLKGD